MTRVLFLLVLVGSFFLMLGSAGAFDRIITPYGDYCKECTSYGVCRDVMPVKESINAMSKYYRQKGYTVGNVYHKGRFIEADIYKNGKQVDKVLFDRKTGRLRSIY
ncbi:MAG: hypothetical protein P8Z71_09330 [Candidatus Sulfobium sp.]|jgi:hypothetical protein